MVTPIHVFQSFASTNVLSSPARRGTAANTELTSHNCFRLQCGIWAIFGLIIIFAAVTKFYLDYQDTGSEIYISWGGLLLILLLFVGLCVICKYCRRRRQYRRQRNTRMQEDHITVTNVPDIDVVDVVDVVGSVVDSVVDVYRATETVPTMTVRENPLPPPYHIAIMIPPSPSPVSADEASPPSYDKDQQQGEDNETENLSS